MIGTQSNLPVSQEDREAAADWCESQPFPSKQAEAPMIRAGEYDHHSLVQAFARHRTQADAAGYRRGVEEAAKVAERSQSGRHGEEPSDSRSRNVATAILALNKDQTDES